MNWFKAAIGLAFVGLIALHSQASANGLSDFSANKFWKLETSSTTGNRSVSWGSEWMRITSHPG